MLNVYLLGGFLIEYDGRALPPISSSAGRSLLAYLITYRQRRHTRDLLAGTFWPEHSEPSARKRLSQALWQIHTALRSADAEESILNVTPGLVSFDADPALFQLDVEEFEALSSVANDDTKTTQARIRGLEEAVDLYRGDFLAGFYDDWMTVERQRVNDIYLECLEHLVSLHKSRSDYQSALSAARRLVLENPVRESAHLEVMRLNFLLGHSTEALRQYDRCASILREELGIDPTSRTRALRDEIETLREKGDGPFVPAIDAPLMGDPRQIPLVGRESERTTAVRRIDDTMAGRGGVVLIEGESGIGKTRFLNELVEDSHWRGATVLWSTSDQSGAGRPYHTVVEALSAGVTELKARQLADVLDPALLADLTHLVPGTSSLLPHLPEPVAMPGMDSRDRLQRAVVEAFKALGRLGAHIWFIDDAHLLEHETLAVVQKLGDSATDVGLLICLAYRSDEARDRTEVWQALRLVDESAHPERIVLERLTKEQTIHLVEESLGVTPVASELVDDIYFDTGGNPLFVLETLRTIHESADESIGPELQPEMTPESTQVADGVVRVISRRFAHLQPEARAVLEAASIIASPFSHPLLTRMCRLDEAQVLNGLAELVDRGIVIHREVGYEFSHHQMRSVARGLIQSRTRRRLHREAAAALEAEHPDRIEQLAHHYAEAGLAEPAMRMAWNSGLQAKALHAYEAAVHFFAQAAQWSTQCSLPLEDYVELLIDWEEALDVLGHRSEQAKVIDLLDEASQETPGLLADAWRRRASLLAKEGDHSSAIDAARTAVELAEDTGDPEARSTAERVLGITLSRSGDAVDARSHLERAVSLAVGVPMEEAEARSALGDVLAEIQEYEDATHQLDAALALFEQAGDPRGVADVVGLLGIVGMESGEAEMAEQLYERALAQAQQIGYRRGEAVNLANLANLQYAEGRLSSALSNYALATEAFDALGDRRGAALVRANSASVRHTVIGDDEAAEADAERALAYFESEGHEWGTAFCGDVLAGIESRRGNLSSARRHLERSLELLSGDRHRWLETHLLRDLAELELELGHVEEGRKCVERALSLCDKLGLADVRPTIESVAAAAEFAAGSLEEAEKLAVHSTAALSASAEQPYLVWWRAHVIALGVGDEKRARHALAKAWDALERTLADVPLDIRRHALEAVPANREIVDAHRRQWSERIHIELPSCEAPLGRKLHGNDWIDVELTLSEPDDYLVDELVERRRVRLRRLVLEAEAQGGSPRVTDLAEALGVSQATLRRDLAAIRSEGIVLETRGNRG